MSETGSIKFQCEHAPGKLVPPEIFREMLECRQKLVGLGLIGVYPNGIGYGNISVRGREPGEFFITGTATGGVKELTPEHLATVTQFDLDRNWVRCEGPIQASSESMTHAALYEAAPTVGAVIHAHHLALWHRLLSRVPTTAVEVEYGTPEMARAVQRLIRETEVLERGIFAMAGHEEGFVTFGDNLGEALEVLLRFFQAAECPP